MNEVVRIAYEGFRDGFLEFFSPVLRATYNIRLGQIDRRIEELTDEEEQVRSYIESHPNNMPAVWSQVHNETMEELSVLQTRRKGLSTKLQRLEHAN